MGYSIPSLVRFEQLLDPTKKTYFKYTYLKLFGNNTKIPYEILTFFLGKLYQKFVLFYNQLPMGHSIPSLIRFEQLLDHMKILYLKLII